MKIGLLSRWNTACGVSLHAELIGREWVRMGHKLTVFAPNNIRPVGEDEEYVIRCFSDEGDHVTETFLDPEPFLTEDYEIFVAERIEWAPLKLLLEIFPKIRSRAKTVYVVHERKPPTNPIFYEFEWDAIVCFDERYEKQWSKLYPGKIRIIPYPVPRIRRGNKFEARKRFRLPLDEFIIVSYGWAPKLHVFPILPYLRELAEKYSFKYLLLVDPEASEALPNLPFMIVRRERPPLDRIYDYLHAADLCLIHKQPEEVREGEVVVSSSVLMCLGALTPIMTSDTEFVSFLNREVIKYRDPSEFKELLSKIIRRELDLNEVLKAAEEYAEKNSQTNVAREFLRLFDEL